MVWLLLLPMVRLRCRALARPLDGGERERVADRFQPLGLDAVGLEVGPVQPVRGEPAAHAVAAEPLPRAEVRDGEHVAGCDDHLPPPLLIGERPISFHASRKLSSTQQVPKWWRTLWPSSVVGVSPWVGAACGLPAPAASMQPM